VPGPRFRLPVPEVLRRRWGRPRGGGRPETRFAPSGGVRIAYEVHDGAPSRRPWVVLVHGLGYGRWGWGPVVQPLADRFRVVLMDNRGIGASDVPPGPYTAAEMAADVLAVLDAEGIRAAHVVGTSLGGMIAQELCLASPERVDRLVLVGSTPGGETAFPIPEPTRQLIAAMPLLPQDVAIRRAVENALGPRTVAERPEVVERILALRRAEPQDPAGWRAQAAAGTTYEGGSRLAGIRAPTLIVHGTEDAVVDPRNAGLLGNLIPGARVVLLEGAGHLPFWEQPERFVCLVSDFLEGSG
jgi:3-oxoadipate enol-lactonase